MYPAPHPRWTPQARVHLEWAYESSFSREASRPPHAPQGATFGAKMRLAITVGLLCATAAWPAATVFNIADYGARKDAPITDAVRAAIQAAKAAGGGTVWI